eukprot:2935779-Rhodomonas_salina.2
MSTLRGSHDIKHGKSPLSWHRFCRDCSCFRSRLVLRHVLTNAYFAGMRRRRRVRGVQVYARLRRLRRLCRLRAAKSNARKHTRRAVWTRHALSSKVVDGFEKLTLVAEN